MIDIVEGDVVDVVLDGSAAHTDAANDHSRTTGYFLDPSSRLTRLLYTALFT